MELTHSFTVPASIEETWAALNDIESVAGCFPGAQVTAVEGDTFSGTVKVKLGPIALVYNGSGTFLDKDEAAHTMRLEAKGKDKRGNGTAGAQVEVSMTAQGADTTVAVRTDLAITGKPAQFGRGVMQDVSDKLLGQFVECLRTKVGGDATVPQAGATGPQAATAPAAAPAVPPTVPAASAPPRDDALDLGATVLPVLARTYARQVVAGLAVLAVLWLVLRRLR